MRCVPAGLATLSLLLVGCAAAPGGERTAYDRSIYQAAVFTPDAVRPLTALAYPVRAANFTGYTQWADGKVGQAVTLARDIWITVEPELHGLCKQHPPNEVVPRLHQILGLKPATEADRNKRFVRMTIEGPQPVGPTGSGIFRPCANPDPKATSCGNKLEGPATYVQWFAGNMLGSYTVGPDMAATGYPWTRLGYTYNWDPAAPDPRGAQEYVVPAGTAVTITAIVTPEEFCKP